MTASGTRLMRTGAVVLVMATAMFTCATAFAQKTIKVVSGAMEPTIHMQQEVRVNLLAYMFGTPARGDVVVSLIPSGTEFRMYRVVAVPGETISYDAHRQLSINNVRVSSVATGASPPPTWPNSKTYEEQLPGSSHLILLEPEQGVASTFPVLAKSGACVIGAGGFTCKVPTGQYFLMGDNREHAMDSRFLGFIPIENVSGRVSSGEGGSGTD